MRTTSMIIGTLAVPIVLMACGTGPRDRMATDRYDTDKHVGAVTDGAQDVKLHRQVQRTGPSASRQDTQAMREELEFHRSDTTQAADAATNEMPAGKDLPGPKVDPGRSQRPGMVEERTVVVVPVEPHDATQDEVALRQDTGGEGTQGLEIARYESDFRQNYEKNFADSGYGYEQYRPAYHYGYELAKDPRYRDMDWHTLESKAHGNWNEGRMGPWERYRDAVHYAWQRVREERS